MMHREHIHILEFRPGVDETRRSFEALATHPVFPLVRDVPKLE